MLDIDGQHWWFAGRQQIVLGEIGRLPVAAPARVLDVGCGSGRILEQLSRLGSLAGLDSSEDSIAAARDRVVGDIRLGLAESLPWEDESFDLVLALDVIEHTPDDRRTLREMLRVTRPGGRLVLTVPAYELLWSDHDVASGHYRRYRRRTLRPALIEAGWEVERLTAFNSWLLPAAALVRLAQRLPGCRSADRLSDLDLSARPLDRLLVGPSRVEGRVLRHGLDLPVGLSLLAVGRRAGIAH
jgi:SAM-dependent methyltransferase